MKLDISGIGSDGMKIKPKSAIGQNNFKFFRRIFDKYEVFRSSISLPSLLFRTLSGRAANNSLCRRSYNNQINVYNTGNSPYKFQEIYKFFSYSAIPSCDFSTCFKKQTSVMVTHVPVYRCSGVNLYQYAVHTGGVKDTKPSFIPGKTGFDSGFKPWLVDHNGLEKTVPGNPGKDKVRFLPVLNIPLSSTKSIQTIVNPMVSKLRKTFSFEFSDSEHNRTVVSLEKTGNASNNTDAVTKGKDLTPKISVNSAILDYKQNGNSKNTGSKQNLIFQESKHRKDSTFGQTGEEEQTIEKSYGSYLSVVETMTSANPMMIRYLSRAIDLNTRQVENGKNPSAKKTAYFAQIFETLAPRIIESLVFRQTGNKSGFQNESNYDSQSTIRNQVSAFQNKGVPQGSIDPSQDNVFSYQRPNIRYVRRFVANNRLIETEADDVYNSKELIFRKNPAKKVEAALENKSGRQSEEMSSDRIYEDPVKEMEKEKMIHEIEFIADRVYKIIERRISIEKDRRGLF